MQPKNFFERNYFWAKELVVLVATVIVIFIFTAVLGFLAHDIPPIYNMPIFGDVLFEDFVSTLIFCSKVAIILVYVIRPVVNIFLWSKQKRR